MQIIGGIVVIYLQWPTVQKKQLIHSKYPKKNQRQYLPFKENHSETCNKFEPPKTTPTPFTLNMNSHSTLNFPEGTSQSFVQTSPRLPFKSNVNSNYVFGENAVFRNNLIKSPMSFKELIKDRVNPELSRPNIDRYTGKSFTDIRQSNKDDELFNTDLYRSFSNLHLSSNKPKAVPKPNIFSVPNVSPRPILSPSRLNGGRVFEWGSRTTWKDPRQVTDMSVPTRSSSQSSGFLSWYSEPLHVNTSCNKCCSKCHPSFEEYRHTSTPVLYHSPNSLSYRNGVPQVLNSSYSPNILSPVSSIGNFDGLSCNDLYINRFVKPTCATNTASNCVRHTFDRTTATNIDLRHFSPH